MKYDFKMEFNKNNSLSQIIRRIKADSDVLEFGCANGRLTKYLKEEKQCNVSIVEIEESAGLQAKQFALHSCIGEVEGDIENFTWAKKLQGVKFDYIIFADVLEHLRNPEEVLKVCKNFLKDCGSIVVSIPNVGNNSILASLYYDEFEYQDIGLLDNTHIKFYTYNTFKRMLGRLDYKVVFETGTFNKIGENEIPIQFDNLDPSLKSLLLNRPFGDVYQFVFEFKNMDIEDKAIHTLESVFPKNAVSYFESVYYMKHNDDRVSEFDTLRLPVQLGMNKHSINLRGNKVTSIRFDPINTSCFVCVDRVVLKSDEIEKELFIESSNAIFQNGNMYVFIDNDPHFDIDVEDGILEIIFNLKELNPNVELINMIEKVLKEKATEFEYEITNKINDFNNLDQEYNKLKEQRVLDIQNFKLQEEMLTKNDSDIRMLNSEIERLRDELGKIQQENDKLKESINYYNSKFYHLRKIK